MAEQKKDQRKKEQRKKVNILMVITIIVGLCIPFGFTAIQMGAFATEPKVDVTQDALDEDAPVLRVAVNDDFCPMSFENEDGELSGLDVEVIEMVANEMGMRVEFLCSDWMTCRQNLQDGNADVILGLEIFSNMEHVLKTIPVATDQLVVYGKDKLDSIGSLAGRKVGLMARSVIMSTFDLKCDYVEYSTNTEILEAVANGDVDYGICHAAVGEKIIEKNKLDIVPSLSIMNSFPAFGVRDDHADLRAQIDQCLRNFADDGTLARLENKWIVEYSRNRSLGYVLEQNQVFYVAYMITWLFILFILILLKAEDMKKQRYITTLLEYQDKLQASSDEVIRANQAKSDFLSHMSHDIRTPINGIMGMTEMIKKDREDDRKVDEYLKKIEKASSHLLSLVNDVLDMSKLESGKIQLEQIPFCLQEELGELEAIAETQAMEKNLAVSCNSSAVQHEHLIGSPLHMRRVLLNLISNAVKYNKNGGSIRLSVREVMQDDKTALLEFKVADTGVGMSKEFIQKELFQPFVQGEMGARTKYQGTGLGMAIVQRIVREMAGTIEVESEEGKGTTFTVTVPFAIDYDEKKDKTEQKKDKTEQKQSTDICGMKILVAEDNDLNLEITQFILEENGADIVVARDGVQAVEVFEKSSENEIQAILMDIMMPNMDGIEAAKVIRGLNRNDAQTVPIIAMTANAFVEDMKKTKEAGMNEHLTKPVDAGTLLLTLCKYYQ